MTQNERLCSLEIYDVADSVLQTIKTHEKKKKTGTEVEKWEQKKNTEPLSN